MRNVIIPLILALLGAAGGTFAGLALRPAAQAGGEGAPLYDDAIAEPAALDGSGHDQTDAPAAGFDYVKLNNQFVVPVVSGRQVDALVVMSLSLEIRQGEREAVYAREPKLRDAMLQVLFDHANMGGFAGAFTDGNTLDILRAALTDTARQVLGDVLNSVLIVDIARQDM